MPSKELILIRHAHRDKSLGSAADNGISEKGKTQAAKLWKHFKKKYGKIKPLVISSPKKRCVETVLAFVDNEESNIEIFSFLDEGGDLATKIKQFTEWWKKQHTDLVVACSHGDWIPECIERLTHEKTELKKGGWAKLVDTGKKIKLVEVM